MGARKTSLAAAAVLGVGWTAIAGWTAAQADTGRTLFVDSGSAHCTDSTTDSSTTPYCSIKAQPQ